MESQILSLNLKVAVLQLRDIKYEMNCENLKIRTDFGIKSDCFQRSLGAEEERRQNRNKESQILSLNLKVAVVQLRDIKYEMNCENLKIRTDFGIKSDCFQRSLGAEEERRQNKNKKQNLLDTGSEQKLCEVCKRVSSFETLSCKLCSREVMGSHELTYVKPEIKPDITSESAVKKPLSCDYKPSANNVISKEEFSCVSCKKTLLSQSDFRKHLLLFHWKTNYLDSKNLVENKGESIVDGNNVSNDAQSSVTSLHQKKSYKCEICNREFQCTSFLERHKISHLKHRNYHCDLCLKSYKHFRGLVGHRKTNHPFDLGLTSNAVHECKSCNKQFSTNSSLRVHLMIHDNVKSHVCKVCGRSFTQKGNLDQHKKRHGDEKPFACTSCSFTFKLKKDLKKHEIVHSKEFNYKCADCGEKFKYRSLLNDHVLRHSNPNSFSCEVCGYGCNNKFVLTAHKKIHDEPQNFICDLCGKKFDRKCLLRAHMSNLHASETYQCYECNRIFKTKQYLRNHLKTHVESSAFQCTCGKTYRSKISLRDHTVLNSH